MDAIVKAHAEEERGERRYARTKKTAGEESLWEAGDCRQELDSPDIISITPKEDGGW